MAAKATSPPADARGRQAQPIVTHGQPRRRGRSRPTSLEEIRNQLEDRYGAKAVYESGLTFGPGSTPELQARGQPRARRRACGALDKLRGSYRKPARNLLAEHGSLETYRHRVDSRFARGRRRARASWTGDRGGDHPRARRAAGTGTIGRSGYAWTRGAPRRSCRRGDLIEVRVRKVDLQGGHPRRHARTGARPRGSRCWPSTITPARFWR